MISRRSDWLPGARTPAGESDVLCGVGSPVGNVCGAQDHDAVAPQGFQGLLDEAVAPRPRRAMSGGVSVSSNNNHNLLRREGRDSEARFGRSSFCSRAARSARNHRHRSSARWRALFISDGNNFLFKRLQTFRTCQVHVHNSSPDGF